MPHGARLLRRMEVNYHSYKAGRPKPPDSRGISLEPSISVPERLEEVTVVWVLVHSIMKC